MAPAAVFPVTRANSQHCLGLLNASSARLVHLDSTRKVALNLVTERAIFVGRELTKASKERVLVIAVRNFRNHRSVVCQSMTACVPLGSSRKQVLRLMSARHAHLAAQPSSAVKVRLTAIVCLGLQKMLTDFVSLVRRASTRMTWP